MTKDICDLIKRRSVCRCVYKGKARVFEPHLLGIDDSGDETLSLWQLSGGSGVGWRDYHVKKISQLQDTGKTFVGSRPGYNPNDSTLARIICRL